MPPKFCLAAVTCNSGSDFNAEIEKRTPIVCEVNVESEHPHKCSFSQNTYFVSII